MKTFNACLYPVPCTLYLFQVNWISLLNWNEPMRKRERISIIIITWEMKTKFHWPIKILAVPKNKLVQCFANSNIQLRQKSRFTFWRKEDAHCHVVRPAWKWWINEILLFFKLEINEIPVCMWFSLSVLVQLVGNNLRSLVFSNFINTQRIVAVDEAFKSNAIFVKFHHQNK